MPRETSTETCSQGSTIILPPIKTRTQERPAVKIANASQNAGQEKVEGAETQDGEYVGGVDDERVAGDAENGGDRVDGQGDIGDFNHQQNHEERRGEKFAGAADEVMLALIVARETEMFIGETEDGVLLGMDGFFLGEQHVYAGVHQERSEQIQHPRESLNQRSTGGNHYAAHDQRTKDAPLQQSLLLALVHGESAEDDQKQKQVINAESLLDEIAGEIFERGRNAEDVVHADTEEDGDGDPHGAPKRGFFNAAFMRLAVKNAQVQHHGEKDEGVEGDPA